MPKRREVPRKACEQYAALMHRSDIPFHEIGRTLQREWPDVFTPDVTPESVNEACRRWSKRHGVELPPKKRRYVPAPVNRYGHEVPELTFPHESRLIVLSDVHASNHSVAQVENAGAVIRDQGITAAVLNGDQLDNAYKGHKGMRSRWAAPYEENIEHFIDIANYWCEQGLERIIVIQGNHDDRPLRDTDGELTYPQWFDAVIRPHLNHPDRFTVTHRYYAIMEPEIKKGWPWPDSWRNFPWRFTHQVEYSKIPLRVAKRLVDALGPYNMVCGHQHHLATGWHDTRLVRLVDAGTLQGTEVAYKSNRDTTHPQWNPGFVTIIDNRPKVHEL